MQKEKTDSEWTASRLTDKFMAAEQETQQLESRTTELLKLLQPTDEQNSGMELDPQALKPPEPSGWCAGTQIEEMGAEEIHERDAPKEDGTSGVGRKSLERQGKENREDRSRSPI